MTFLAGLFASIQVNPPGGMWERLLRLVSGMIPVYVWAIIVFTIFLKLVLSPLDFFQRYKMKKNERLTKKLEPEMEKLARQCGDDKAMLQQRQFQLQKAAGFSYFSACIPMILTMVIFITFWSGMRNISQYEEFKQYVNRYDIYIGRYSELTGLDMYGTKTGENSADFDTLINEWWVNQPQETPYTGTQIDAYLTYKQYADFKTFYADYLSRTEIRNHVVFNDILKVEDNFTYSDENIKRAGTKIYDPSYIYSLDYSAATAEQKQAIDNYIKGVNANIEACKNKTSATISPVTFESFKSLRDELNYYDLLSDRYLPVILSVADSAAADEVYKDYKSEKPGFLWIKSIWAADVPWARAVPNYSDFRNNVSSYMVDNKGGLDPALHNEVKKAETYNKVMAKVRDDKDLSGTNGYLILAVLSIGLSFLSQFISMRQQKRAGTAATSNATFKTMMYIMPITIGIFAVISTAAFSIYMITNSIMTLLINMLSSFVMARFFKDDDVNAQGVVKYGRRDPNDKKA